MRIETERLLLEPLMPADLDDLLALHAHPQVAEFVGTLDPVMARSRLADNERHWTERGHGRMAIRDRATGRFLGRTGLLYWPQFVEVEVGWTLAPDAWGHGYATEAATACIEWGFENLSVPYLTAMVHPRNERSLRVAHRLGFERLRDDVLVDVPVIVHWRPRPLVAG
jgi:RimJ/RimL family protein N-acetyltransferase